VWGPLKKGGKNSGSRHLTTVSTGHPECSRDIWFMGKGLFPRIFWVTCGFLNLGLGWERTEVLSVWLTKSGLRSQADTIYGQQAFRSRLLRNRCFAFTRVPAAKWALACLSGIASVLEELKPPGPCYVAVSEDLMLLVANRMLWEPWLSTTMLRVPCRTSKCSYAEAERTSPLRLVLSLFWLQMNPSTLQL